MDYSGIIGNAERRYGLQPGMLASVWQQESGGSTNLGLQGEQLSRGRGHATGPFQIVPYYHPEADLGSFESQADYAAKYLKEVGVEGYYGTGQAPAGHPTTEQYAQQVRSRLPGQQTQAQEPQPMQNSYQNPVTASAVQGVMQPQEPQPQMPMMQDPMFWIQAAAGMGGGGGNPMSGIAQGFGQAVNAYQARNQMSPYERAKIDALREEAAMRQGISPLEQAKLAQRKAEFSATQQATEEARDRQQASAEVAMQRQMEADARAREKYEYEVSGRGKGSVQSGFKRTVNDDGSIVDEPIEGTKEYQARLEDVGKLEDSLSKVNRMTELYSQNRTEAMPLLSDQEVAGEMQTVYTGMVADIAKLRDMGVLQPGELTNIEKSLTNPTTVGSYFTPEKKVLAQYKALAAQYEDKLKRARSRLPAGARQGGAGQGRPATPAVDQDGWGKMTVDEPGGA